jgi:prostaglandin-endoperoxide synthase 2
MIVILLKIVAGDYVGHISSIDFPFKVVPGMAEKEQWYRTNWISIEFDLLYRWHSMVPERLMVEGTGYTSDQYRNNPKLLVDHGVDRLVTAASRQYAGRIGMKNTPEMFFVPMPK